MEISLVYDKSDQHTSVYDSCNCETASTTVDSVKLENTNNSYSLSNEINFELKNENYKFLLYFQFSAWYCSGCSVALITDYANSELYRELQRLNKIYTDSDERLLLDFRSGEIDKISPNKVICC